MTNRIPKNRIASDETRNYVNEKDSKMQDKTAYPDDIIITE